MSRFSDLSTIPYPNFIDHFPVVARGHGSAHSSSPSGVPNERRRYDPRRKACVEGPCERNSLQLRGSHHEAGRATLAGAWMRDVAYQGPSPGISASGEEKPREIEIKPLALKARYKDGCRLTSLHSVCRLGSELRVGIRDRMLAKIDQIGTSKQEQRRLAQLAGLGRL